MFRRAAFFIGILILLCAAPATLTRAQGGETCLPIVAQALHTLDSECADLGRNEACYGSNHVDATFWEVRDDLVFNFPGSRVPLIDLRTLAATALDETNQLWGVAALHLYGAELPETLPGQAVMFLVMGDTRLENAVSPDAAAGPVPPVEARTTAPADLMAAPLINASVQGRLPEGTTLQIVGLDETGGWAQVELNSGLREWISRALIEADPLALSELPVTYGPDVAARYGPMQAFYFTTGLGEPTCYDAPNALIVQSPQQLEIALNVNELAIHLDSTIVLAMAAGPGGQRILVMALLEGQLTLTLNGQTITLTQPGQAVALTLNAEGRVDENSRLVTPPNSVEGTVQSACRSAVLAALFERSVFAAACDIPLSYTLPPAPPAPLPPPVIPTFSGVFPATTVPSGTATPTACVWPVMTAPASGINVTGSGTLTVSFSPAPNAAYHVWYVQGDQHSYFATGATTTGSFVINVGDLPGGQRGLGYWIWARPFDANGNPLCPESRSPNAIWISKDLGGAPTTNPPPQNTAVPTPTPSATPTGFIVTPDVTEPPVNNRSSCGNDICGPGEDRYTCPEDCVLPICGDGFCDQNEDARTCPADCSITGT